MNKLRPKGLDDIIGQERIVHLLRIISSSAQTRNDVIPHILLSGPPGLGKTSMAMALANDVGRPIKVLNGGAIRTIKDILPTLLKTKQYGIIFIDEIHRLPITVEEFMYPVMEDFRADLKKKSVELKPFTLIGATTACGGLSEPFRDRFVYHLGLEFYALDELSRLVTANAAALGILIDDRAKLAICKMSRGTPRIANNILIWLRDHFASKNVTISDKDVLKVGKNIGIDSNGLSTVDRKYIEILRKSDGPVGLSTIAGMLSVSEGTVKDGIEPYLLRLGLIKKTRKGRMLC